VEEAVSRSWIQVARQTRLVHLKRGRRVRDALDPSPCPTRGSPTSLPPGRPLLERPYQPFNSLPESSASAPWRTARATAINYNLSTRYLILVILQEPLFLREMINTFSNSSIE